MTGYIVDHDRKQDWTKYTPLRSTVRRDLDTGEGGADPNLKSPSRKERLNETPHLSVYAQFQQFGQKDCFIHHIIGFLDVNKNC